MHHDTLHHETLRPSPPLRGDAEVSLIWAIKTSRHGRTAVIRESVGRETYKKSHTSCRSIISKALEDVSVDAVPASICSTVIVMSYIECHAVGFSRCSGSKSAVSIITVGCMLVTNAGRSMLDWSDDSMDDFLRVRLMNRRVAGP